MSEVSVGPRGIASSHLEVIKRLIRKVGFSCWVGEVISSDVKGFTAALYQGTESLSMQGHCSAISRVLPVSLQGPQALAAIHLISRIFQSLEQFWPAREVQPPDWNLSLVLRSVTCPPYKALKMSLNKYLSWNACFLLALMSAKRITELHGFFFFFFFFFCVYVCVCVWHLHGWRSCTFFFLTYFVAKTQNPSIPDPKLEFLVSYLNDFMESDQDELLLYPISTLFKYLACTEQFCPEVTSLLSLLVGGRNGCLKTPFPFGFFTSSPTAMFLLLLRIAGIYGAGRHVIAFQAELFSPSGSEG